MTKEKRLDTHALVLISVLTAIEIVLSRFCSLSAWDIKIGFSFVPVAVAAVLLGPVPAGIVAALGDFLGAILFPIGPYFPGFTLTAFCTGIVLGLFLRKSQTVPRILGAVLVNQLVFSLLLNSFWISLLYTSPYVPLLATRLVQCAVLGPVQFIVIGVMTKALGRYRRRAIA